LPAAAGAKVVVNVALCPAAKVIGSDGAFKPKPLPVMEARVIVRIASLEFVIVTLWLLLEPIGTFPKLRFVGLTARFPGATHPDCITMTNSTAARIGNPERWARSSLK
jgi:hypothetical protein